MSADEPIAPGLYLVATPIGNLEDITLRALRVLRQADRIACEDTRQTAKLLHHFGITTPTVSYHEHNELARSAELLEALQSGGRIAVVSDAGTPGIADPGALLTREAIAAGIPVFPIPGANAAINALIASGLSAEKFSFQGFLPEKQGARRTALERLRQRGVPHVPTLGHGNEPAMTHIFYEAPHRIAGTLEDIIATFGPRHPIALARELTKLHEEFLRGTAAEVLESITRRDSIRGEMVLLIDGHIRTETAATTQPLAAEVESLIKSGLSEKDALKQAAKSRGLGKSEAYREWQRGRSRLR